ncbi:GMC family oxidoreductase N-terminal domain-containing protein [Brucella pituitosa]|uniref:GMC family oxidoreductase N-terminal domain-containing protein n=1 Tax=Brucella pituitosa TaxID=571256 RepID=UPI002093BA66|nr:GMC family oxidoreductase N-terminal domain-containing protein [Brucella pituitosa]
MTCVVLGQDPYPEPGFATGRAFEAGNLAGWNELNKMFSKSIRAYTQQIVAARTGDMSYARSFDDWPKTLTAIESSAVELEHPSKIADRWISEGALLLNASLTLTRFKVDIDPHQSQGHLVLWQPLIIETLRTLAARGKPLVFLGLATRLRRPSHWQALTKPLAEICAAFCAIIRRALTKCSPALIHSFFATIFWRRWVLSPSLGNMAATKTFDYIIIGAGSAGCVLANRLSADPANKVLLLEAGGQDLNPLFRLPMLMGKLFHSGIYNWHYHTEPEPHLNDRSLYWPRGKVLGGTSTINGMIYVRGNRHDYDRWAQMGATGWSYDEVLPAFLRSETHVQRKDDFHSTKGELTVCRARGWNGLLDVFNEAGEQAGYPLNDDFNGGEQEGFGRYDFTITKGKRCSAAYAFLRPAKKSGLT